MCSMPCCELPWHLAATIGFLSVLGLIGTVVLWYQQVEQAAAMPHQLEPAAVPVAFKTDERVPKPASKASDVLKSDAPMPPAAQGGSSQPSSAGMKDSELTEFKKTTSDGKSVDAGKTAGNEDINKSKELNLPPLGAKTNTPAPAQTQMQGGKINVPGNEDTQLIQRSQAYQAAPGGQQTQLQNEQRGRNRGLADNRATVVPLINPTQVSGLDKAGARILSKQENGQEKIQPPSPLTGNFKSMTEAARPGIAGGRGSGGAGGGLGSGGFGKPASDALLKNMADKDGVKDSSKKYDSEKSDNEGRQQNSFYLREYSWKAEAKPAGITQSTATWSKTVYWHPLEIVPTGGRLELPIDLPPNEGVYHFEVFGHDGEGRLGAASIDIPAPLQSVSLQTRLSRNKAKVGDVIQLECQVQNLSTRRQPQVIAKVQLPEGTALPPSLKQLRFAAKAASSDDSTEPTRWSVQGHELTLIWAELAAGQRARLSIDLHCNKPTEATTGASKAYLENQETDAAVAPGLSLRISK